MKSSLLVALLGLHWISGLSRAEPVPAVKRVQSASIAAVADSAMQGNGNGKILGGYYRGLFLVNPDGTHRTKIPGVGAAFSPDGKRIAYLSDGKRIAYLDGQSELGAEPRDLYVMNADGTHRICLAKRVKAVIPFFSPDGKKVVFRGYQSPEDLQKLSSPKKPLNLSDLDQNGPFEDVLADKADLWIIDVDGKHRRRLTHNLTVGVESASFLPDGKKFLFARRTLDKIGDIRGQIYTMNANGTHPVALTHGNNDFSPHLSPDGKKIVFMSDRANLDICVMDVDGKHPRDLTNVPASASTGGSIYDLGSPCFSPDGKKIAFDLVTRFIGSEIYTMNSDGAGKTRLCRGWRPQWAPGFVPPPFPLKVASAASGSGKIAFTSSLGGKDTVAVINADGSNATQFPTATDSLFSPPRFSPDGTKIVFASKQGFELCIMGADGARPVRFTLPIPAQNPCLSPDGKQLLFGGFADGQLWSLQTDGTHLRQFPLQMKLVDSANFSPDGTKIVFRGSLESDQDLKCQIWMMNAEGTHLVPLTQGRSDNFPCFSPDGTKIAFFSGNGSIFVMDADGGHPINLTKISDPKDYGNSYHLRSHPSFSADGTKIFYDLRTVETDPGTQIWSVNVDGTHPTHLFDGDAPSCAPGFVLPPRPSAVTETKSRVRIKH